MYLYKILSILSFVGTVISDDSPCMCTTVPCPQNGENNIIMGQGGANMTYIYETFNEIPVIVSGYGTVLPSSLHNGSETTTCVRNYSNMMEDDNKDDCDAGHILANRLGGYGNEPLNIFPQLSTINQGIYNQFEGKIYDCMLNSTMGYLEWKFYYETNENTQPYQLSYYAKFEDSPCEPLYSEFPN